MASFRGHMYPIIWYVNLNVSVLVDLGQLDGSRSNSSEIDKRVNHVSLYVYLLDPDLR